MKPLQEKIFNIGLFAVLPVADGELLARAADALVQGGIYGIIFSWNKHLFSVVEQVHKNHPQLLIGVQGPYEQSGQLFAGGASFVVGTGEVPAQVQIPFFLRKGNNLLDGKTVLAQSSNKLASVRDLKEQRWVTLTQRAKCAVQELLGFELRHIGINHQDASGADQTASTFERLFGFPKQDKGGAYFAGPYIEAMKKMFYGVHGHIAIATNNATRAAWYLEQRGARFNWKSADYNPDGNLRVVYLQDEIGGFAVHIIQK